MTHLRHIYTNEFVKDENTLYYYTECGELINGQDYVDSMLLADDHINCCLCRGNDDE